MSESSPSFSGTLVANYKQYVVPMFFDGYARDLAGGIRIPPGGRVLETACGTGVLTRHLVASVDADATIVATDLSPDMVAAAREDDSSGRVEYREADATDLPFDDAIFDAVVGQFGVMFFPDKEQGYREALRVLKPGGCLAFSTWDALEHNDLAHFLNAQVQQLFPEDPPTFVEAAFGYHDTSTIGAQLGNAGFTDVDVNKVPREARARSATDVARGLVLGSPLVAYLVEKDCVNETLDAITVAFAERFGTGEVVTPMQAIVVTARKSEGNRG